MKIPDFQYLSVPSGLRIICAGVWHNFVLAVGAYILVQTFVGSALIAPVYTKVDGVLITHVYGVSIFLPPELYPFLLLGCLQQSKAWFHYSKNQ